MAINSQISLAKNVKMDIYGHIYMYFKLKHM